MLPRLSGRQPEEEEGQCCARAPPKCQLVFSLTVIDRQARHAKIGSRGDVRVVDSRVSCGSGLLFYAVWYKE